MPTRTANVGGPIELAHVAPFRLGELSVEPATCQIFLGEHSRVLEPRVMQVLVALVQADGAVVTREELTELCWKGRIVSESAMNRVLSRLRKVAAEFPARPFQLETITKVGYRLLDCSRTGDVDPVHPKRYSGKTGSRRAFLGGVSAVAAIAVAGTAYRLSRPSLGLPAEKLYQKGVEARAQGSSNMVGQAEAYFAQAVEADPNFGKAWAALALARAGQVSWEQGQAQEMMAEQARSAARRALRIDPDSVEAKTALAFVPSAFGRWAEAQADYRRLLRAPGKTSHAEWVLRARLSYSLGEVGRCKDALQEFRRAALIYPSHPFSSVGLAHALWNAGEVEEAKAESDRALVRFPRHPDVWFMRMALLTYTSRPEAAVAFARDRSQLPFRETGEGLIFRRVLTAQALAELKPEDIEQAVRLHLASVAANREEVPAAVRFFAALGRLDTVFELLRGYFQNSGKFADDDRPPPGPLTRYAMFDLFWPPMKPVWNDPRFAQLAEQIGLETYWRTTGSRPDYRSV